MPRIHEIVSADAMHEIAKFDNNWDYIDEVVKILNSKMPEFYFQLDKSEREIFLAEYRSTVGGLPQYFKIFKEREH